jgi:large subunit ribosomal protein L3
MAKSDNTKEGNVVGILGRKIGMTQVYDESGQVVPVTVVAAGPCHVLQIRTPEVDGYSAVQLGYLDKPRRLASRSQRGQVAKLDSKRSKSRAAAGVELAAKPNCEPKRFVREIRDGAEGLEVGGEVSVDAFSDIASVDVTATSKGRGFAGVMKRHNFAGQRATHGVKKCHRHAGGTGSGSAYPSRLFKGIRMAGHYGNARCTVRNQKVVRVDTEQNLLLIRGAVPGPNGGYVVVQQTNKL